ncbi:hypothetical protein WICPIJ_006787 [Wickerhamomyces pijperi]|uniref:Uncharacterized protein n=1 Tax=Wickerhamomyces pijperi TaxID=599730 RepID=A0A9P8TJW7_WICPI|nr:hypothetical protein WICPIJ_006787 [Wickerhamomyces pijperi]
MSQVLDLALALTLIKIKNNNGLHDIIDVVNHFHGLIYQPESYTDHKGEMTNISTAATIELFNSMESQEESSSEYHEEYLVDQIYEISEDSTQESENHIPDDQTGEPSSSAESLQAVSRPITRNSSTPIPEPIIIRENSLILTPSSSSSQLHDFINKGSLVSDLPVSAISVPDPAVISDVKVTKRKAVREDVEANVNLNQRRYNKKLKSLEKEQKKNTYSVDFDLQELLKNDDFDPKVEASFMNIQGPIKGILYAKDLRCIDYNTVKIHRLSLLALEKFKDVGQLGETDANEIYGVLLRYAKALFLINHDTGKKEETRLRKLTLLCQSLKELIQINERFTYVMIFLIKDLIVFFIESKGLLKNKGKSAYVKRYSIETSKYVSRLKLNSRDNIHKLLKGDELISVGQFRIVLKLLFETLDHDICTLIEEDYILKISTRIILLGKC